MKEDGEKDVIDLTGAEKTTGAKKKNNAAGMKEKPNSKQPAKITSNLPPRSTLGKPQPPATNTTDSPQPIKRSIKPIPSFSLPKRCRRNPRKIK